MWHKIFDILFFGRHSIPSGTLIPGPNPWNLQGWVFALSLFAILLKISHIKERLWAIRSRCSSKRATVSNHFRRSLIWTTVSELLSSFCKKEWHEWFAHAYSVLKSNESESITVSKMSDSLEKFIFFVCSWQLFTAFPLFYAIEQIAPVALRLKERLSDREGIAPVALC